MPMAKRFLLALGAEAAWEVFENTPMVIEHYRQQALAQGYIGDSILNSISDTIAMAFGFFLAAKWPVFVITLLAIGMEVFVGFAIRDNLFLNVLGFVYQPDFITTWQTGG